MFDEDAVGFSSTHDLIVEVTQKAIVEAAAADLPFDIRNAVTSNPFYFGAFRPTDDSMIGRSARFLGEHIFDLEGKPFDVNDVPEVARGVGTVVAYEFGRVVIAFEHETLGYVYLGWTNIDEVEIVNIHFGVSLCRH